MKNLKQIFIIAALLFAGQYTFGQSAPNKTDRKGNKDGLWADTTCKEKRVICVERGSYDHGIKTGTWITSVIWDTELRSKSFIVTEPYSAGKKNGWGTAHQFSPGKAGDTVLTRRDFYRDDSLIEAIDYVVKYSSGDYQRVRTIPDYRIYVNADSTVQIKYFSDLVEDSGKIDTRTCWVSYSAVGSVSRSTYGRPAVPKCTIIDEYYDNGQKKKHTDSLFWINRYVTVEYHENGQIKRAQQRNGAIQPMKLIEERILWTYYKNEVVYTTRRPDTVMTRTDTVAEFDDKGRTIRTVYALYKDSALASIVDSVFNPPGVLREYSTRIIYPDRTGLEVKYFPSGKISYTRHTLKGDTAFMDTSFYESGALKEIWIRGRSAVYSTHIEYAENGNVTYLSERNKKFDRVINFNKSGQRTESIWTNDTVRFDTVYYESGNIKELCEGLNKNKRKCVTRYENGSTKIIETWTNGVYRKEEYDENGHLIQPK